MQTVLLINDVFMIFTKVNPNLLYNVDSFATNFLWNYVIWNKMKIFEGMKVQSSLSKFKKNQSTNCTKFLVEVMGLSMAD